MGSVEFLRSFLHIHTDCSEFIRHVSYLDFPAPDSKSGGREVVLVRVRPGAPVAHEQHSHRTAAGSSALADKIVQPIFQSPHDMPARDMRGAARVHVVKSGHEPETIEYFPRL